jgi:hypothetical protein
MLTVQERRRQLELVIALLQDAAVGVEAALGDTDAGFDLLCGCESLIDDLRDEIEAIEADELDSDCV